VCVLGVDSKGGVEAATFVFGVARPGGKPGPAWDDDDHGAGEVGDHERSIAGAEAVDRGVRGSRGGAGPAEADAMAVRAQAMSAARRWAARLGGA
jgi:hypothetical protein